MASDLTVRPLTLERLDDLADLFGTTKTTSGCYCMWFVTSAKECGAGWGGGNRRSFESLAERAAEPLGLLAYRNGRTVGWCAAGPRARYARALRSAVMKGRDPGEHGSVWLVPCFYVGRGARGAGVTRALLDSAVALARAHRAVAVEGFPLAGAGRRSSASAFVGVEPLFASCGFTVVERPTANRVVMRRSLR